MVAMLSLPVGAQDVKKSAAPLVAGEEEVVEDRDESEAAAGQEPPLARKGSSRSPARN